jgi:thiol-disulfide isomerase/thioredoxin
VFCVPTPSTRPVAGLKPGELHLIMSRTENHPSLERRIPVAGERFASRSNRGLNLRAARLAIFVMPLLSVVPAILAAGCSDAKEEKEAAAAAAAVPPSQPAMVPGPKGEPLTPGDKLPLLKAAGWINGEPPAFGTPGVRLIVVDLWANWCPYCGHGAPHLVKLFNKYRDRGVAFVSITNMDEGTVQRHTQQFSIIWPNGYGLGAADMAAMGIGAGGIAASMPAYGLAPTVYLADGAGRVRWCDQQGRFRHVESQEWIRQLDEAIENELAKIAGPK